MAVTSSTKSLTYEEAGFAFRVFEKIGCSDTKSIFSKHVVSFQSMPFTNSCLKDKSWRCELLQDQQNQKYGAGFVYASEVANKTLSVKMVGFGQKPNRVHLGAICQRFVELAQGEQATKVSLYASSHCFSYREWKKNGFRSTSLRTSSRSLDLLVLNISKNALTPFKYLAKTHAKVATTQKTQNEGMELEGKLHSIPIKKEYIEQIRAGRKVIEGRLNKLPFSKIAVGDHIKFHYYRPQDNILCKVVGITAYTDFRELLESEGVGRVLPEVMDLEAGVALYEAIPKYAANVGKTGALAIQIEFVGNVQNKKRKRDSKTENGVEEAPATKKQRIKLQIRYPLQNPLEMTLGEEYIDQVLSGRKTKEGRIFGGAFSRLNAGDHIRFFAKWNPTHDVICKVTKAEAFWSFREMLEAGGIKSYLPKLQNATVDKGVNCYHSIDGYQQRAEKNGVIGLTLEALGTSDTVYKSQKGGVSDVWTH